MSIRKTEKEDISYVMAVIDEAKEYFRHNGIPQWQNGYPNSETIRSDIENGNSYVLLKDQTIAGTACIITGNEPNYDVIEDGEWLNDEPYAVVHRICISTSLKGNGYAKELMEYAETLAKEKGYRNVRADTHELNYSMQRFLQKCGFTACGRIYVSDHTARTGYQKILE